MTTQAIGSATTSSSNKTTTKKELGSDDFIKLMITQLQNQDPSQPMSNSELLSQMSQISQLQSNTSLQDTLKGLTTQGQQSQLGLAGQLIGKMVAGVDADGKKIKGLVTSVRVENNKIQLELDNGKTLSMDQVTDIAAGSSSTTSGQTHHAPA